MDKHGHPSTEEATLTKAGRLAALLMLDDMGLLEGRTLQSIADALGVPERSTIMRDKRLLPEVRRRRDAAAKKLSVLASDEKIPAVPTS
jgi:hypothetical protein